MRLRLIIRSRSEVEVIGALTGEDFRRETEDGSAIKQSNNQTIEQFPKVLVDAPCSNTGVLRRRPDARWNWSVEKLEALVKLQAEILDQVEPLVAPGGTLVYSTCSNEPEENFEQVNAFLSRHPDFTLDVTRDSVPFESGHDGAFAARFVRR